MKKILVSGAAILLLLIASFIWMGPVQAPLPHLPKQGIQLIAPDGTVHRQMMVEVADDPAERGQGLMYRNVLAQGSGMLFIFDQQEDLSFWMKNTHIPLDILFFADDGSFVSRTSMDPCLADPCTTYPSGGPALYALEVNRGEQLAGEVGEGWKMRIKTTEIMQ